MDTLAELLARLANIADLDDEAVAALRGQIVEAAEAVAAGEVGADEVALLGQAADGVETIDGALATRAEESAALAAQRDDALARIRGAIDGTDADAGPQDDEPEQPAEPEPEPETPTADTPAVPDAPAADAPAPAEAGEEQLPIAAAAPPAPTTPRAPARQPARHRPAAAAARATGTGLVAAGDIKGRSAGSEFATIAEVGQALFEKASAMGRSLGGDGEQVSVAMRNYGDEYPPERRLSSSDSADAILEKIMSVVRPAARRDAVVAAGGLCAPVAINYNLITYGSTARPIRDALPSFLATRGGLTFNTSPVLSDILLDQTGGALGTVTLAQDQSGPTKTTQEILCGTTSTEYVQAITNSLKTSNLNDRYYPELMRAWVSLVDVAHARYAESILFRGLISRSTKHYTNTPAKFGAYRDFKRSVFGLLEEIGDLLRDDGVSLRAVVPEYLAAMLATDLMAQQPGDSAFQWTEAQVKADMQSWDPSLSFTFAMDGSNGRLLTTAANNGKTPGFDADVDWIIYPEGTFTFLDGGQIDLGIIRDSLLIASNRFITFSESMEGLARPGPLAYRVTSSLCAGGDTQVATDISVCSPQGS